MPCYRTEAGAIVLTVRLTPKSSRDAIDGIGRLSDDSEVVLARVRKPPAEGAANAALIVLVAKAFRVPKSSIELVSGATARLKHVRIFGDPANLAKVVESWRKA